VSIFDHLTAQERAILAARAARISQPLRNSSMEEHLTALTIVSDGKSYALPIELVVAVHENIPITPVPCVPSYIAGIANIHGRIVPVVALNVLFGGEADSEPHALVLISDDTITVALPVDDVSMIHNAPRAMPVPSHIELRHSRYVSGVLPNGAVLLDVGALLSDTALVVEETVQ
jgi:purine-binding chemotaxis protein CheW